METAGVAALVLSTALSMLLVPDVHAGDLVEPTILAAVSTPIVLTAILALRLRGASPLWERRLLAAFLLAMPTVYLASLALHGGNGRWLTTEAAGQAIFATIAIVGLRGSGWILAGG